jgi:carbamoyl-phosphate synthase small subunit
VTQAALLALEDGSTFRGRSLGSSGETFGEVVFNTAMSGYQEVLTDPSYARQIVTMTSPQQGNYGTNDADAVSVGLDEVIPATPVGNDEICRIGPPSIGIRQLLVAS